MNIGIVTTWFERGAAYVSKQYMNILSSDFNVFIYARGGEHYAINDKNWDFENVKWGKKNYFQINPTPIDKKDFLSWIRKNNIDIILFNEQQWWPPVIWAKEENVKVGAYVDYYTQETVPFFGIYDFLICNTKRHYSVFKWHEQCYYVPWGTDINLFKPREKRSEDIDKIVFFNSSGFNPERKGVYPLIKAFYRIKEYDNIKLILHSQVNLKKYYKDIAYIIDELIESNKLEIIDKTVPAPGLYHLADVYCYISKLDGIGLTLPEAISCGLQAIVPNNAPMNEFVKHGYNGYLVKVRSFKTRSDGYYWKECEVDDDALLKALQYYIDNRTRINEMKSSAREYAIKNLNWNDRKEQLKSIFTEIRATDVNKKLIEDILKYEQKRLKNTGFVDKLKLIYRNIKR